MDLQNNRSLYTFNNLYVFTIVGFLLNFMAYYPGFMSPDTFDIYEQSISQHYRDWHPPAMALLWHALNKIYQGPQLMLAFQLILLWMSFYLLSSSWISSFRSRLIFFITILIAPFIQNFAGYLIKDAQMALSWCLSFCIIARAEYSNRRMTIPEAIIALLFLFYGSLVRINALPGVIPLLYLWCGNCLQWRKKVKLVTAVFVLLVSFLGGYIFLYHVVKPQKQYPEYKLFLHDLSGIYVKTGKNYFPDFINQHAGFDTNYLKANYTAATIDNLYWNEEKKNSFPVLDSGTRSVIQTAWLKSISENPGTYLANRGEGFLYFLRIKKRTWIVTMHAEVSSNSFGIVFKENLLSKIFIKIIRFQSSWPYMRPWFWLIINIALLIAASYAYSTVIRRIIFALSFSSLYYLLFQFFVFQVDTDFRYFYWNCIALSIAAFFFVRDKMLRKKEI